MWQGILPAHGFMPAASPKALTVISRTIRRWTLHQRSDKSLQDLANMYNPYIRGWINYYGQFYRAQLRSNSAAYRWLPSPTFSTRGLRQRF